MGAPTLDTPVDRANAQMRRRTADLRFRFGLILAVALLPLLVFSIWQATIEYREDTRSRAELLETSAVMSVEGLMSTISDTFTQLEVLRDTVDGEICRTEFDAVLHAAREIDHLVLADREGRYVCTVTDVASKMQAFDLARTLTPDAPTHIEIRRPPAGVDEPSVLVLSLGDFRVEDGRSDTPQRIFLAAINLSRLDGLTRSTDLSRDNDVAVLSRSGDMLYRSSERFPMLESESYGDLSSGRRRLRAQAPDRSRRQVTVLTTGVPELYTAISEPERQLLSPQAVSALMPALLPLLAWLFAFAAIWVAADRLILSHLRQLRGAALHFASGDMTARVGELAEAPDQIGQLGRTFDLMASRIAEREASLQANLDEKSILLREIHHRVKNNLQIIISLLNMQQRELEDPEGRNAIEEARNRVGAIALVHRSLYESDDLQDVDMKPFLDQLVGDLYRSLEGRKRGIDVNTDLGREEFDSEMAIPLALFVVEAVTNAIKHGIPEGGQLEVRFAKSDGHRNDGRVLVISDSGPGPDKNAISSTGWRLMRGFARQVHGEFETEKTADGFEVRLTF